MSCCHAPRVATEAIAARSAETRRTDCDLFGMRTHLRRSEPVRAMKCIEHPTPNFSDVAWVESRHGTHCSRITSQDRSSQSAVEFGGIAGGIGVLGGAVTRARRGPACGGGLSQPWSRCRSRRAAARVTDRPALPCGRAALQAESQVRLQTRSGRRRVPPHGVTRFPSEAPAAPCQRVPAY